MIKFPFLTKSFDCIQIGINSIRYIKLNKTISSIRVTNLDTIEITEENWQNALQNLANKVTIENDNLAILLPYENFTNLVLDDPDIDDIDELKEWIEDYLNHYTNISTTRIEYDFIKYGENQSKKILISYIHNAVLNKYKDNIRKLNIIPQFIGSFIDTIKYSLISNEYQFNQNSLYIIRSENIQLVKLRKGILINYQEVENSDYSLNNLINVDDYTIQNSDKSLKNISVWEINDDDCSNSVLEEYEQNTMFYLDYYKSSLSSEFLPLIGLLNSFIFKLPCGFNFVGEKIALESKLSYLKKQTKKLASYALGVICLFILLTQIFSFILRSQNNKNETELSKINEKVQLLQIKQNRINKLKSLWEKTSEVSSDSTFFTGFINVISSDLPKDLWFNELSISRDKQDYTIRLNGFAVNQSNVAKILSNYEQSRYFQEVKLDFIEITPEKVNRKLKLNQVAKLYKFQITVRN